MTVTNRHDNISFNILPLDKTSNGKKYKIQIQVPMFAGWIEHMNFVVEKWRETLYFRLDRGSTEPMQPMPRRHIHESWDEPVVIGGDKELLEFFKKMGQVRKEQSFME